MNKLRAVITTLAIAAVTTVTAQADNKAEKTISFDNNGTIVSYETSAETLGEFLSTMEEEVVEGYFIKEDLETELGDENLFQVEEKVTVKINFNVGEKIQLKYPNGITVGEIISDLETQNPGKTYFYDLGDLEKVIDSNYLLNFRVGEKEVIKKIAPIYYETTKIETDELFVGETEVQVAGVEGRHEVLVTKTYINGELIERVEEELQLLREPVTEVILVGTKAKAFELGKTTDVSNLSFSKKITMNASAYSTDGATAYTASGRVAQIGVVAVDTSVIPFGTKLYIEGYGYAVAGDTGGAIKGNKVDLFMNTTKECLNFGRQNVTVYVLN